MRMRHAGDHSPPRSGRIRLQPSAVDRLSFAACSHSKLKTIAFVFDRVMHYHRELFQHLDEILPKFGYKLVLLSGREKAQTLGRVALKSKIVRDQIEFDLTEMSIRSYTVRYQHGLKAQLRRLKPAVVVTMCHAGTISEWQVLRLKKEMNFQLIAWQCGYEFNPGQIKRFVLRYFVPRFDHHLAYHSNAQRYAVAHGARPDQVTVMHNTINERSIACVDRTEARSIVEERHPQLVAKRIVLYVGAILEEKRLEIVFEALDRLNRSDVAFVLVGDGPHLPRIKQCFGSREYFVTTGRLVEGVGVYFDAADVFVLPGTGGLAINEAMAHGLPVISGYADGSADDLVIDSRTGYRLRRGDAGELENCLRDLLADGEKAARMGREGEALIRGEFSFERFIDSVVGVLTDRCHAGST